MFEPAAPIDVELPIKGDVNSDGEVNTADLVMMQKYLLGAGYLNSYFSSDINEDGRVDIFDSVSLRKLLIRV